MTKDSTPLWALFPFLGYLLSIAGLPFVRGEFWESNRNKLVVAVVASLPVLVFVLGRPDAGAQLGRAATDYLSFMALAAHPFGQTLLAAVSCGSVFMGAVTYLGNGPNFMVKAIAEQHGVRMPSFSGFALWSFAILLPLFGVVSALLF